MNQQHLIQQLYSIGAIKTGHFTLASGMTSSIYIDLRHMISYPALLREASAALWEKIAHLKFDLICGVPYTALPIATCLSLDHQLPMLICRKEQKTYGTKKKIEGLFKPGQTCLIIEDVVTTSQSVQKTIQTLQEEEIVVRDVAVLVDREQGGSQNLMSQGYQLHAVFSLTNLCDAAEQ